VPDQPAAAPSPAQVAADFRYWHASAVVAETTPGTVLAAYLDQALGAPAVVTGGLMAWRLD